jgi:RNA ligase (TIGR02306 family)
MSERKLVSIREISEIIPIPNADAIEVIAVDGWKVVAKKGEFLPGDLCVYFEIDSVLPIQDRYEFLRKCCYVNKEFVEGFRLKTAKLRGQISQGLVLPISAFPEDMSKEIGTDLTDYLGVIKWDPPLPLSLTGLALGHFPSFIPKTDQERIQNIDPDTFRKYQSEHTWEVTEKLEGTSTTYYWNNGHFGVCTRNLELQDTEDSAQWSIAKNYGLMEFLKKLNRNIAIQGELIGPGIQSNYYGGKQKDFYVFDIFDIDTGSKLNSCERLEIWGELSNLSISHVPVISDNYKLPNNVEQLIQFADGISEINGYSNREGLVFKSMTDGSTSFKVISNKYLL